MSSIAFMKLTHHEQMSADKVVVLSGGRVIEIGKPKDLLAKPGGEFKEMVHAAGLDVRSK